MPATEHTTKRLQTRIALAAALAMIGLAGVARADPVDLRVVDRETGRVLRVWDHDGRLFVAGRPGARYGLRVTNHTDGRVLVVMSVDGVNVLTGETAGWDQRGYVFGPHETYDVTGWRKSETQVAAFKFAPLPQSYAARTGRPDEVGVIGIAVFDEKIEPPPPAPEPPVSELERSAPELRRGAPPATLAPAPPPSMVGAARAGHAAESEDSLAEADRAAPRDEKLGTAHGAREWSRVYTVDFERATSYPQFTRQIEYDSYANLVALGVIRPYAQAQRHPRPFPSSPEGGPYVPDPPDDP